MRLANFLPLADINPNWNYHCFTACIHTSIVLPCRRIGKRAEARGEVNLTLMSFPVRFIAAFLHVRTASRVSRREFYQTKGQLRWKFIVIISGVDAKAVKPDEQCTWGRQLKILLEKFINRLRGSLKFIPKVAFITEMLNCCGFKRGTGLYVKLKAKFANLEIGVGINGYNLSFRCYLLLYLRCGPINL